MSRTILVRLDQLGHAIVERRKLSLVLLRQSQKISVGDLAMSNQRQARKDRRVRRRDVIGPEMVTSQRSDFLQYRQRFPRTYGVRNDLRVG